MKLPRVCCPRTMWMVLLCLGAAGTIACGSPPASPPPAAARTFPETHGPAPVLVNALPIPANLDVTEKGRAAIQVLGNADAFGGAAKGYSGLPVPAVHALRTILAEKNAADALAIVIEHGTLPAQLLALSGLYYADHAAFTKVVERYRAMDSTVRVLEDGCSDEERQIAVRELVESKGAMRFLGPEETLAAWVKRNPGVTTLTYDIVGGGFPHSLRGHEGG